MTAGVFFRSAADLGDALYAESAEVHRGLSGLFRVVVRVRHEEEGGLADDQIDALLTHPACVGSLAQPGHEAFGVVSEVRMKSVTGPSLTHYELTLEPRLSRLAYVRRSRVFQDMTHLEVVMRVLEEHGFEAGTHVEDKTEEDYPNAEYVVQYRETDLAFIQRLLAHQGIHFHFVTTPDGTEVLVLADRNAAFEPSEAGEALRYAPDSGALEDGAAALYGLERVRRTVTRRVLMRDYNWRVPHHPLRIGETVDDTTGYGYVERYGEHFHDDGEGTRLAKLRAEEAAVTRDVFEARTSLPGLWPGRVFELAGHPHPARDGRYLVVESREGFESGLGYENRLSAIPFDVPYRPARTIPWPRVHGLLHGVVDGEQRSTATPIDGEGRYRVVLPVDECGTAGGRASRWVRRAQPSAGAAYGMHFPLHIGTEVTIGHVHGDPDRPIILGAVPNAATESPVRAGNAPQSRIATGSGAVIELDDDC